MYQGLVFVHLLGLVLFVMAHGVSVLVAFRIRAERDPKVVGAFLGVSQMAVGGMYVGLLLLGIGGLGAAWAGGLLLAPWIVASYVVVVVVLAVMYSVATPYYGRLRQLVTDGPGAAGGDLDTELATRRPEVLATVGFAGLVVLVWLMVFKPG